MRYKVVIAEDFKMIREVFENAVRSSDCFELAGSFPTADDAVSFVRGAYADLVLLDVLFPGGQSGLQAARTIRQEHPEVKLLIVTSMPEMSYVRQARELGAEGFWYKEVQEQPILTVMERIMAGERVYPSAGPRVMLGNAASDEFTDREIDVLRELVGGASNKEIGDLLGITENTVKMHVSNMLQKTGYHSRLELAVMARHTGVAIKG